MAGNSTRRQWPMSAAARLLMIFIIIALLLLVGWEYRCKIAEARRRSALLAYAACFNDHTQSATTQPISLAQAFLGFLPHSLASRISPAEPNRQPGRFHSILYLNEGFNKDSSTWLAILSTSDKIYLVADGKRSQISQELTQDMVSGNKQVKIYFFKGR